MINMTDLRGRSKIINQEKKKHMTQDEQLFHCAIFGELS